MTYICKHNLGVLLNLKHVLRITLWMYSAYSMDGVINKMQITLLRGKNLGIMQQHKFTYEVDSLTRRYSIAPYLP